MRLIPLLITFQILHAQYTERNNYSVADACPDPQKHHIASRTVYTTTSTDIFGEPIDTMYEAYDRNGKLIAQHFYFADKIPQNAVHINYEFTYDLHQRIKLESVAGQPHFVYTYSANGDTVTMRYLHVAAMNTIVESKCWYNHALRDTTEIAIDESGDTVCFSYSKPNSRTVVNRKRVENRMQLTDSNVVHCNSERILNYTYYLDPNSETGYSTMMTISNLNKKGRVIKEEQFRENNFRRSTETFEYTRKGKISKTELLIYPEPYSPTDTTSTTLTTKYLYDSKGILAQQQHWSDEQPNLLFLSNYIYNEENLLIEIHRVVLDRGAIVTEEREHWEYTFY